MGRRRGNDAFLGRRKKSNRSPLTHARGGLGGEKRESRICRLVQEAKEELYPSGHFRNWEGREKIEDRAYARRGYSSRSTAILSPIKERNGRQVIRLGTNEGTGGA